VKTLVLGGTRFMGAATVERLLAHGHEVTIFNRGTRPNPWPGRVRAFRGDRTVAGALSCLADEPFDAVVDFCAYTAADSAHLLAAVPSVERLVHVSSGTVYALDPHLPWTEETAYGPAQLWGGYARGKIECEQLLRRERPTGTATTALRFPWVLGPRSYADRERFVLNRLLDGEEILLPGDGQAVQQFLSVDQAADAIVGALEAFGDGGWRAYNIASPGYASLEGFVSICSAVAGAEPRTRRVEGGPTGTGAAVFNMSDCVFPYPNQNYILDLAASAAVGIAPVFVALEETIEASLGELRDRPELRAWQRTAAESRLLEASFRPAANRR
jgi:2'-hydroxyisoflavone reductase